MLGIIVYSRCFKRITATHTHACTHKPFSFLLPLDFNLLFLFVKVEDPKRVKKSTEI
jgi:hypothetical protein